jgi:hypothetical protein
MAFGRSTLIVASLVVLLTVGACGPQDGLAASSEQDGTPTSSASAAPAATSPVAATPTASPTASVAKRLVTETVPVPFTERTVNDPALPRGSRVVRVPGVNGAKTLTYEVTVVDGVETDRKLVSESVTRQPVTQVVAVGTKQELTCDPNYSGCVPIASDVDCAGGSGNGPAYVRGPVRVIGTDIYDLDRDGDGIACE